MGLTAATAGLIGAGISAAGSAGAAMINSSGHRWSQKRALVFNKELSKYNYDMEMEAWREANRYNSPSAQMERYREAGLNPNLIYQQGNEAASAAPTAGGSVSEFGFPDVDFSPVVDSYSKLTQLALYRQRQDAEVRNINANTESVIADTILKALNKEKFESGRPYWSLNEKYQSDKYKAEADNLHSDLLKKLYQMMIDMPVATDQERQKLRGLQLQNTFQEYENEGAKFKAQGYAAANELVDALKKNYKSLAHAIRKNLGIKDRFDLMQLILDASSGVNPFAGISYRLNRMLNNKD